MLGAASSLAQRLRRRQQQQCGESWNPDRDHNACGHSNFREHQPFHQHHFDSAVVCDVVEPLNKNRASVQ